MGRPKSITLPGGRVVDLGYNFAGRQFTVTPPGTKQSSAVAEQRPAHIFGVDAAGLLTAYTAPDIGATVPRVATHGWDKDKAPMGMFLPQPATLPSRTTFVSYDEAGRVKGLGHSATGSVAARTAEITYDAMGRPSVLTSKVGGSVTSTATTTYTSGLVTQVSTAITGATTVPIAYQYDGFMRVKTRTIGGAVPIASTWDSATGLLTATGGVGITRTGLVGGFQSGQLAGLTASGGRTYTVTYPVEPVTLKGYGEPQRLEAKFGATSKYSVTLGRDALGRITTRQEVNEGTPKNRFYVYDTAGRLWKVYDGVDAAGVLLATYTYDSNGNRTDQAYGYDLHDRQTSFGAASYAYDANGERKTRSTPAQTLTYDPQGQLVSVDAAGTVITYEVDGHGRRVKRTKNGVSERYLWEGARIAAVLDNAGAVVRRFVYATRGHVPDAILEGSAGTLYLVVKDERGSVRQLIDPAGAVAEKYEYDEWGKELPGAPVARKSLFGFAGGVYDQDTGLVRFGARDYDPAVGRWTAKDASRFGGGWNLYGYCHQDPINYVDPSGLEPVDEYTWWLEQPGNTGSKGVSMALHAIDVLAGGLGYRVAEVVTAFSRGFGSGFASIGCQPGSPCIGMVVPGGGIGTLPRSRAADAVQLSKQLASEAQMCGGASATIAGPGARASFRDAQRIADTYGGKPGDWSKVSSPNFTAADGTQFETHWVENVLTGEQVEFKTKLLP